MWPSHREGPHVILSEAKDPVIQAGRKRTGSLVASLLGMTQG